MRASAGLAVVVLTSAGCALPPQFISGSHVADPRYQHLSCPELETAQTNVERELGLASVEQSRFVGVVFPSEEFKRNTRKIADLKGTLAAIGRAQTTADCAAAAARHAGEAAALPAVEPGLENPAAESGDFPAGAAGW